MSENELTWLTDTFQPVSFMENKLTVSIVLMNQSFANLTMYAKIGLDEVARRREMLDHPNVMEAYDHYITLLALTKSYE